MSTESIYLDHSATTPVDPRVIEAMLPYWTEGYGNPSSVHSQGRKAKQGLESARRTIAKRLGCQPTELVFTGCGSEADNLAIRGVMMAARRDGRGNHMITSVIEHEAVVGTAHQLAELYNFDLSVVGVDEFGRVDPEAVRSAIREDTVLVSIMAANNEIGTLQPIQEIGEIAHEHGALFHTDAVQAANLIEWDMSQMPIDLLCLAPHKFYGPKGVGVLYVRDGVDLVPHLSGGSQENGRRAGTVNVPFAVGTGVALDLAMEERETYIAHCIAMRDRLISGIMAAFDENEVMLTGHPTERLPHHTSFAFKGLAGNEIIIQLDAAGIAGSSGSACSSGNPKPSTILQAIGLSEAWCSGGLRLTVGKHTTAEQVDQVIETLPQAIQKLKSFAALFS